MLSMNTAVCMVVDMSKIKDFHTQRKWLYSLITDPEGKRFFERPNTVEKRKQLEEQVERTTNFLSFIGNPQENFKSIHVAGTSGKGSVTTMISSILYACDFNVADHTSPYLQIVNEKLRFNRKMISPLDFTNLILNFREHYSAWEKMGEFLCYTEAWVVLTFIWCSQIEIDWAVIETSMGGRYDPTVVLPSKLAVITNINLDHTQSLGNTLKEIAWHKAGIIRPNCPVVTAERNPEALSIIKEEATRKNSPLYFLDYKKNNDCSITIRTPITTYENIPLNQKGTFYLKNVALAVTAVDILASEYNFSLTKKEILAGLDNCNFPGRYEIIQTSPMVIIDGAHNPHKMESLTDAILQEYGEKTITVIVGFILNKEIDEMILSLERISSHFIIAEPNVFGKPAQSSDNIAKHIKKLSPKSTIEKAVDLQNTIKNTLAKMSSSDMLLITGSIYLIGEAREYWYPTNDLLVDLM